jgi:hypothetical protein
MDVHPREAWNRRQHGCCRCRPSTPRSVVRQENRRQGEGRVLTGGRGRPAQDDDLEQVWGGASGGEASSGLKHDRGSSSSNGRRGQAPVQPPRGAR